MPKNPESEQHDEKVQAAHERLVRVCALMRHKFTALETAGIVLGAVKVVLEESEGRKRANDLLREVVGRLGPYDGPPPGAERN
jgi:hypothetical protein